MFHITVITSFLSLSLSLCLSVFPSQIAPLSQPAGRGRGHKEFSLRSSPPTAITCLRPQLNTSSPPPSPATLRGFKSHGSARPPPGPAWFRPMNKRELDGAALQSDCPQCTCMRGKRQRGASVWRPAALLCRAAELLALGSVLAPELMSSMGSRRIRGSEVCRASSSSALIRVRSCMLKLRSLSDSTPCPWAQTAKHHTFHSWHL